MKMTVTCNQTNQESFSYENPRPVETKLCNIGPEALMNTTNHLYYTSYSRLVMFNVLCSTLAMLALKCCLISFKETVST